MVVRILVSFTFLFFTYSLFGQFVLNGDAIATAPDCYRLTDAQNFQSGAIWHPDKINLNESFEVATRVFLGCSDEGADGIVFVFQPADTEVGVGDVGGGIGFLGLSPALGVELDTWTNEEYNDPMEDHIAVISNGDIDHAQSTNLAGPVPMLLGGGNVENCFFHELDISWNASTQTLEVFFDCDLRLTYTGDIVNEIFGGDPEVFWGFTSATGGAFNVHEICFDFTTFLDAPQDVVLCPEGQVQLVVGGGESYLWSPADFLSDPTIANPIANPPMTTLYEVEITDECGRIFILDVLVEVNGAIADFDLGPDTLLCEGDLYILDATTPNATYQWSNGITDPLIEVSNADDFSVTITIADCIAEDYVEIDFIELQSIALPEDTLLCGNAILEIGAAAEFANFLWQDGSTDSIFTVTEPGNYTLTVFNTCGTISNSIRVDYAECEEVFAPNIFSPNGDGLNDTWTIFTGADVVEIVDLKIFNRWGSLLFENNNFAPNDLAAGWDGEFKGENAIQDVYTFFAVIQYIDGSTELKTGDITLLR